jgi:hypothetical protein
LASLQINPGLFSSQDESWGSGQTLIGETLAQSYRDILKENEGTAFSLPRDAKVWEKVQTQFDRNLALIRKVRLK